MAEGNSRELNWMVGRLHLQYSLE